MPNGRLVRPSPLTPLIEIEGRSTPSMPRRRGWALDAAGLESGIAPELPSLIERATPRSSDCGPSTPQSPRRCCRSRISPAAVPAPQVRSSQPHCTPDPRCTPYRTGVQREHRTQRSKLTGACEGAGGRGEVRSAAGTPGRAPVLVRLVGDPLELEDSRLVRRRAAAQQPRVVDRRTGGAHPPGRRRAWPAPEWRCRW